MNVCSVSPCQPVSNPLTPLSPFPPPGDPRLWLRPHLRPPPRHRGGGGHPRRADELPRGVGAAAAGELPPAGKPGHGAAAGGPRQRLDEDVRMDARRGVLVGRRKEEDSKSTSSVQIL